MFFKAINSVKNKLKTLSSKDFFDFLNHAKNYVSASFFIKGFGIITIPIFTRLLSPDDYGILAVLASFTAVVGIIYKLGIHGSISRYYYERKPDIGCFLGSVLILISMWGLFFSVLLFVFSNYVHSFLQIPGNLIYIGVGIVFFSVFFHFYESYLVASKRSRKVASLSLLHSLTGIVLAVGLIVIITEDKYYGKAMALLFTSIAFGVYSITQFWNTITLKINKKYLQYAMLFSLPLVFHSLSHYLLKSFDVVIINQLVGKSETGLYSVAYKVGMVQNVVAMGMLKAWNPIFFDNMNKQNYDSINHLASKFAKIVYITAFGLILFSRELISILADSSFHAALSIIPIVIISYVFVFLYTMYVNFAFYHKKTHLIAIMTLIAGLLNVGLNYWLIPIYGYMVAAWTTLCSYIVLFILHYLSARFIIKSEGLTRLKVLLPNFVILVGFVIIFSYLNAMELNVYVLYFIKIAMLVTLALIYLGKRLHQITKSR